MFHVFQSTLPSQGATFTAANWDEYLCIFQSTLPSQGATFFSFSLIGFNAISIHAPLTGSDCLLRQCCTLGGISIHAPLTGSDVIFNQKCSDFSISIHAPLTGSDSSSALIATSHDYFNPRSPHRERHNPLAVINPLSAISIHAPLTGSDDHEIALRLASFDFNPRSPHRERLPFHIIH